MKKAFYHEVHEDHEGFGEAVSFFPENDASKQVVDAAFKVHQTLGSGLLESAYEECLAFELKKRGFRIEKQKPMPVFYEGHKIELGYRLDIVVNDSFIIEVKSVERIVAIHEAQLLTYMKLSKIPVGFLINFNVKMFKDGVKRYCL